MAVFRPCIDLHEGKVKQLVGGSFSAEPGSLRTNFVSTRSSAWYAELYRRDQLRGGHVIMLGPGNESAAREALAAYPGGLQIGGGINAENASTFLEAGAAHVIVTSWVFRDGRLDFDRLQELVRTVGKARLVLDLSCRIRDGQYWVVTDRWQKFTELAISQENLERLAEHCAEFLVHAVDVEGLCGGVDLKLIDMLGRWSPIPTTYAGGARSHADLEEVTRVGGGRLDLTIGSALDIFGGSGVRYEDCVAFNRQHAAAPARKTILSLGEILWDLLPDGSMLGGAPFNFAYRVHALGNRSTFISRLGSDDLARRAREQATALGMDTTLLQLDTAHPTGTVNVTFDARKNPDYFIVTNVAYDFIEGNEEALAAAARADCICFGTLIQRTPVSRRALRQVFAAASPGALKVLDLNLRKGCYSQDAITESLMRADVLKLNEGEAQQLREFFQLPAGSLIEFAERMLARWRLQICVITLGERGALAVSAKGEKVYTAGYRIEVVDTCGAGDAFTAGFVHRFLQGCGLADCCQWGNALGALVAMRPGGTTPVGLAELQQLLASDTPRIADPELRTLVNPS